MKFGSRERNVQVSGDRLVGSASSKFFKDMAFARREWFRALGSRIVVR